MAINKERKSTTWYNLFLALVPPTGLSTHIGTASTFFVFFLNFFLSKVFFYSFFFRRQLLFLLTQNYPIGETETKIGRKLINKSCLRNNSINKYRTMCRPTYLYIKAIYANKNILPINDKNLKENCTVTLIKFFQTNDFTRDEDIRDTLR